MEQELNPLQEIMVGIQLFTLKNTDALEHPIQNHTNAFEFPQGMEWFIPLTITVALQGMNQNYEGGTFNNFLSMLLT